MLEMLKEMNNKAVQPIIHAPQYRNNNDHNFNERNIYTHPNYDQHFNSSMYHSSFNIPCYNSSSIPSRGFPNDHSSINSYRNRQDLYSHHNQTSGSGIQLQQPNISHLSSNNNNQTQSNQM
jgi:hypothetical protein